MTLLLGQVHYCLHRIVPERATTRARGIARQSTSCLLKLEHQAPCRGYSTTALNFNRLNKKLFHLQCQISRT